VFPFCTIGLRRRLKISRFSRAKAPVPLRKALLYKRLLPSRANPPLYFFRILPGSYPSQSYIPPPICGFSPSGINADPSDPAPSLALLIRLHVRLYVCVGRDVEMWSGASLHENSDVLVPALIFPNVPLPHRVFSSPSEAPCETLDCLLLILLFSMELVPLHIATFIACEPSRQRNFSAESSSQLGGTSPLRKAPIQ